MRTYDITDITVELPDGSRHNLLKLLVPLEPYEVMKDFNGCKFTDKNNKEVSFTDALSIIDKQYEGMVE